MICGVVLAGIALLWVVTRPTLSTQARMFSPSTAVGADDDSPAPRETGPAPELEPDDPAPPKQAKEDSPLLSDVADKAPGQPERTSDSAAATPPPDLTVFEKDEKITTTRFHIVQKDETLSAISQQYYGTANRWQRILEANKLTVKDANKIRPGTKLIIP